MRTRRAGWVFATASILFLTAAMVSLAAGRGAAAAFLVLGLAFLVIAMGIGRASRQWAEPDHATQRPANKRFRLARHGVRFESRRSARS